MAVKKQRKMLLTVKEIAEAFKCMPMLTKKQLEKAGAKIIRQKGVAKVWVHPDSLAAERVLEMRLRKKMDKQEKKLRAV